MGRRGRFFRHRETPHRAPGEKVTVNPAHAGVAEAAVASAHETPVAASESTNVQLGNRRLTASQFLTAPQLILRRRQELWPLISRRVKSWRIYRHSAIRCPMWIASPDN